MSSTCYYYQILRKLEFSQQILKKFSNIKLHEDPSSESRVVPYRQMGGQTDMMKLTVAFHNFANAPKNWLMLLASGLCLVLLRTLSMKE